MRYRAFISYSQRDKAAAKRLHQALEAYRVPRGAVVEVGPDRTLGRFCRDEEEMGAAADIAASVRGAIEDSESLIVLCSPRSATSHWVNAEILHFRATARAGRVFAVIVDGTPNAANPEDECFPPALRVAVDPANPDEMPIEPLALDLRKDGRTRTVVRLAAGLLQVDFDDLWHRDRRRAAARRTQIGIGAVVVLSSFGALGAWAIREQSVAHSRQLAQASMTQSDTGQFDRALRLAVLAARDGGWLGPASQESAPALTRAAEGAPAGAGASSGGRAFVQMSGHEGAVTLAVFSPDGVRVGTAGVDGTARIWDAKTGAQLHVLRGPVDDPSTNGLDERQVASLAFSPDGSRVATASMDNSTRIYDAVSGEALVRVEGCPGWDPTVVWVPDGTRIVTRGADRCRRFWNVGDGREVSPRAGDETAGEQPGFLLDLSSGNSVRLRERHQGDVLAELIGHEGTVSSAANGELGTPWIATASLDGTARLWDGRDGTEVARFIGHEAGVTSVAFNATWTHIVTASDDGTARVWRVPQAEAEVKDVDRAKSVTVDRVCHPESGQLRGTLRVITAQDVVAVPMLAGRAGEDVCKSR